MSTNPAWLTELWEENITKDVSFLWCYLISRGFHLGKGNAGILCPWHQVGSLTVKFLIKHLRTHSWEYPPNEAKLNTSVQNALRHLYHALTLTAAFLSFYVVFCTLIILTSPGLYCCIYCTAYLWGQKIKNNPCSIQRCAGFQLALNWGWKECLGQVSECVSEERRHRHYFHPADTENRRRRTRMCSGVVLEAGNLCEAVKGGKGSVGQDPLQSQRWKWRTGKADRIWER